MTAKASRACESDLWERRLRVRQRWSASGGTLGARGQWHSPCTCFFPIAMSLRSTTAAMRRAAAGQAQPQCYRFAVIFDHLRQVQADEPILAIGFSIGSAVAAVSPGIDPSWG